MMTNALPVQTFFQMQKMSLLEKVKSHATAQVYRELCMVCSALQEYDEARDFCLEAIALIPDSGFSYQLLGVVYRFLEQPDVALEAFEHALRLLKSIGPDDSYLLCQLQLASTLSVLGFSQEAAGYLTLVSEEDQDRLMSYPFVR